MVETSKLSQYQARINSYSKEGRHHLDSALLTPTIGDHCKGEHTRTNKHKQKGKLTEIREK